jgi:deazaflavin-dependent oxidoreductase (nitroreductase family)
VLSAGTRIFNPLMRGLAGSRRLPLFAVVRHRGRRSGRSYATPVAARMTPDGFIIPLTFGARADWFRNVRAAGGCVIGWKGAEYAVVEPEIVAWADARSAFTPLERTLVPLIGIQRFVRLRRAPLDEAVYPSQSSA